MTSKDSFYVIDHATNLFESRWINGAIPSSGTALYSIKWDWLIGRQKLSQWNLSWRYMEVKDIVIHAEINSLRISGGIINNRGCLSPTMPMFMVYWDRQGMTDHPGGVLSTDLAFTETPGVKFIQRGKPVTFNWISPSIFYGRPFELQSIDLNSDIQSSYKLRFSTDGYILSPGPIQLRLQDAYLYDWGAGTIMTVSFRTIIRVRLTGSRKFEESMLDGLKDFDPGLFSTASLKRKREYEIEDIEHVDISC